MAGQPFRIGIVGLGEVAEAHLEAYREVPALEIVGGVDIDERRLADMSKRYSFRPYRHVGEMLEHARMDGVCVLTPAANHRQVTEQCAQAGLPVLCEKPIAVDLPDAEAMRSTCAEHGVKLFYGASYRFLPAVIKAREIVESGAIGEVLLLSEVSVGGSGQDGYRALGTQHYPEGEPGGPGMGLVDHGIHLIDTFRWLTGSEIVSVFGRGIVSGSPPVTEFMIMEFENGATGHLLYNDHTFSTDLPYHGSFTWGDAWESDGYKKRGSWLSHPGCIHVHGTLGALRIMHYANALYLTDADGTRQVELLNRPAPAQFAMQMQAFIECVEKGTEPAVSADDGIIALQALRAAYRSKERGAAIRPGSVRRA